MTAYDEPSQYVKYVTTLVLATRPSLGHDRAVNSHEIEPLRTAAVVLAAGSGSRYGGMTHKLMASFRGTTVLAWALHHADEGGLDELLVVTSAATTAHVIALAATIRTPLVVIENPRAHEGQATSLCLALERAGNRCHDAVVAGLGDQPLIEPATWTALASATSTPIAVATYDGQRRNPVRLARDVWHLVPDQGDEGARGLLRLRPDLVTEIPSRGNPADIDTVEDLQQWNS